MFSPKLDKAGELLDRFCQELQKMILSRTSLRYVGYYETSSGTPTYHEWNDLSEARKWFEWASKNYAYKSPIIVDRKNPTPGFKANTYIEQELSPTGKILPAARCGRIIKKSEPLAG